MAQPPRWRTMACILASRGGSLAGARGNARSGARSGAAAGMGTSRPHLRPCRSGEGGTRIHIRGTRADVRVGREVDLLSLMPTSKPWQS